MRPIDTAVAWFVCLSVCWSRAETVEPIEIPFELWTSELWGPKEPCIRWGSDALRGEGHFKGFKGRNWACLDLPAVDNLDLIRNGAAAMRPPATCRLRCKTTRQSINLLTYTTTSIFRTYARD